MNKLRIFLACLLVLLSDAASAQIGIGGLGGGVGARLPGALDNPLGTVDRATGRLDRDLRNTMQTARDLVGRPANSTRLLGRDERGAAVVRNEVLAVAPAEASLVIARQLGFSVIGRDQLDALGLSSVTLRAPDGMDAVQALNRLRQADPAGTYDYAHIYNPASTTFTGGKFVRQEFLPFQVVLQCSTVLMSYQDYKHSPICSRRQPNRNSYIADKSVFGTRPDVLSG